MSEEKSIYKTRKQTIFRTIKNADNPFVMIDRRPLENDTLSWKAKGVLAYLLSRPDNWIVRLQDLVKRSPDGVHAVRGALRELKKSGHVSSREIRDAEGKFVRYELEVYELPFTNKPLTNYPQADNPLADNLNINDTDSNNTEFNNIGVPPKVEELSLENQIFAGVGKVTLRDEAEERRLKMVDMANLIDFQAPGAGALAFAFMQTRGIIFTEKQVKAQRNKAKELLDAGVTPKHVIEATKGVMTARQRNGKPYTCTDLFSIERNALNAANPIPEEKPRMQTIGVS